MKTRIRKNRQTGASMVEYCVLLCCIFLGSVPAVSLVGGSLKDSFTVAAGGSSTSMPIFDSAPAGPIQRQERSPRLPDLEPDSDPVTGPNPVHPPHPIGDPDPIGDAN